MQQGYSGVLQLYSRSCCRGVVLGDAADQLNAYMSAGLRARFQAGMIMKRKQAEEQAMLTASERSTTTLTFSRTCSATVLLQLNCRRTCASKMWTTRAMLYSVSSSVSSSGSALLNTSPRLLSCGMRCSVSAYSDAATGGCNYTTQRQCQ